MFIPFTHFLYIYVCIVLKVCAHIYTENIIK